MFDSQSIDDDSCNIDIHRSVSPNDHNIHKTIDRSYYIYIKSNNRYKYKNPSCVHKILKTNRKI
ncbi:hypothetical protein BLOT_016758 [Blomia tropicalis]|nr:hypothetical protein BLOT_016758 [Blomia tropicalis]